MKGGKYGSQNAYQRHGLSRLQRDIQFDFREDIHRIEEEKRATAMLLTLLKRHHPTGDPYTDYRLGI